MSTSVLLIEVKNRSGLGRKMHEFPGAAVTNDCKFSSLKQHKFILSARGQMSDMGLTGLKPRCRQGCTPSGGSREESVLLPFPASRGFPHSLACDPLLHLQSLSL